MSVDQWLSAISWQGQRCPDLVHQRRTFGEGTPDPNVDEYRESFTRSRVDEHLFSIAAWRAILWLDQLLKIQPELAPMAADLLAFREQARDTRDMHEHEIEYLFGGGHHPDRFAIEAQIKGGLTFRSDASSTLVIGESHLVGGRLPVREIMAAAARLRVSLPAPGSFLWSSS